MKFSLVYEGKLKSNGNAKHKHDIRTEFCKQLENLWKLDPLGGLLDFALGKKEASLMSLGNERLDFPGNPHYRNGRGWIVKRRDSHFLPVVCKSLRTTAEIDITWYRAAKPGNVLHQGDIDNRLKTLFDAFQVPDDNQISAVNINSTPEMPFFTVLEDDALISRINVITKQDLRIIADNEVTLFIDIKTKVSDATFENMNFI